MFWDEKRDYNPSSSSYTSTSLSSRTRQHLISVYSRLIVIILFTMLASFLSVTGYIPQAGMMPALAGAGTLFAIQSLSHSQQLARNGLLFGFGFLEGWSLAPLANMLLQADPAMLYQSLLMTLLIFGSFSLTAIFSQRRAFLAYGGILLSSLAILSLVSVINIFFPSQLILDGIVYIGLLIFAFFVSYHTQLIVERAESGLNLQLDSVGDAVLLFNNIISIFIRIAIVLMEQEKRKKRDREGEKKNKKHF